jgi:hypothetical protein
MSPSDFTPYDDANDQADRDAAHQPAKPVNANRMIVPNRVATTSRATTLTSQVFIEVSLALATDALSSGLLVATDLGPRIDRTVSRGGTRPGSTRDASVGREDCLGLAACCVRRGRVHFLL